jgi:hypothetical protein
VSQVDSINNRSLFSRWEKQDEQVIECKMSGEACSGVAEFVPLRCCTIRIQSPPRLRVTEQYFERPGGGRGRSGVGHSKDARCGAVEVSDTARVTQYKQPHTQENDFRLCISLFSIRLG